MPFCRSSTICHFVSYQSSRLPSHPLRLSVSGVAVRVWASSRSTSATGHTEKEGGNGWMNVIIGTLGASHTRHQSQTNPPVPLRTAVWLSGLSARHILTPPGDLRPGIHARLPLPCPNQRLQFSPNFRENPWPGLSCRSSTGNCTNLAVLDKWVSHSGSTSLIAARAGHWCLPKDRRFFLAPKP